MQTTDVNTLSSLSSGPCGQANQSETRKAIQYDVKTNAKTPYCILASTQPYTVMGWITVLVLGRQQVERECRRGCQFCNQLYGASYVSNVPTPSSLCVLFCLRALSHLGALSHSRVVVSANKKARFLIYAGVNCPIFASRCPNLALPGWSQLANLLRAAHPYLSRGLLNFPAPPGNRVGGTVGLQHCISLDWERSG